MRSSSHGRPHSPESMGLGVSFSEMASRPRPYSPVMALKPGATLLENGNFLSLPMFRPFAGFANPSPEPTEELSGLRTEHP
jgi:hypothetical protein